MSVARKTEHKMHLTDYLWMLKKRLLLIVFIWVVIFTAVAVATFMQKPQYQAVAQLLIESSTQQTPVPGMATSSLSEEFYNSQVQMLRSRGIARGLYNDMQMYLWPAFQRIPDEDHISIVQSWIRVTLLARTHLVNVSMVRQNPVQARDMVNKVTDLYKKVVEEFRTTSSQRATKVLTDRATDIQRTMEVTARSIQLLSAERGIYVVPEMMNATIVRERWLQDATSQAKVEQIAADSRLKALQESIEKGQYVETNETDLLQNLRSQRYALDEMEQMEKGSRTDQYRRKDEISRNLQIRLEQTDRQIALERQRLQQIALTKASQDAATATANFDVLDAMLTGNRQALAQISQDLQALDALKKQYLGLDAIRSSLEKAAQDVKTTYEFEEARVQIISPADIPKSKYSPNPELNLPLGGVVGLLVGVMAAFFFEYLNTTIRMPRDIEDGLGLPVLGFVPAMSPKLKDFESRALISHADPSSGPAEAFRGIRTEIMLRTDLRQVRTGLVTSTSPQEGKSTVAVNWAIALAQAGNKVLLIDADLRKPVLHRVFNMTNERGLSTLLAEKESATVYIRKTEIENLHVLTGGPVPLNPAELLGSRKMRTLLAEASERYDSVILDSAPVLGVADANILGTMVDCVVLVVQASKNRRALVIRAKNQLANVNARVAGAVLNNVRGSKGDYYYYRQYYRPVAEMMEQQEKL